MTEGIIELLIYFDDSSQSLRKFEARGYRFDRFIMSSLCISNGL